MRPVVDRLVQWPRWAGEGCVDRLLAVRTRVDLITVVLFVLLTSLVLGAPGRGPLRTLTYALVIMRLILGVMPTDKRTFKKVCRTDRVTSIMGAVLATNALLMFLRSNR